MHFQDNARRARFLKRIGYIFSMGLIVVIASVLAFSERGIFSDDSGDYISRADNVYFDHRWPTDSPGLFGAILYPILIACSYPLVGHTLLASHLAPFILTILTAVGVLLWLDRLLLHPAWAFLGTLLYLWYPTNRSWMNQNLTEPVFVFCIVFTLLMLEYARRQPQWLVLVGVGLSFCVLARVFDGAFSAGLIGLVIVAHHHKHFPWRWCGWGLVAFVSIQMVFAIGLHYSVMDYVRYFQMMASGNTVLQAGVPDSSLALTKMAVKTYSTWYWGGKFTPLLLLLLCSGAIYSIHAKSLGAFFYASGYGVFLLTYFGGRHEPLLLTRQSIKILPALIALLVSGGKFYYDLLTRWMKPKTAWLPYLFMFLFFGGGGTIAYRKNQQFIRLMTEIIPSASLGTIIRTNPELARNIASLENDYREELLKAVTGQYRPMYRLQRAKAAWQADLPGQARAQADFAYMDSFTDGQRWKAEAFEVSGNFALWSAMYPEHLGAFPYGAEGTVIYKFSFPRKARQIVLSDIHTHWAPGDIVRLWTSPDGSHWTLRYDDADLRYQEIYYHEVFTDEMAGYQALYLKYYLRAGDPSRRTDDNRGATVSEFSVAVTFQQP